MRERHGQIRAVRGDSIRKCVASLDWNYGVICKELWHWLTESKPNCQRARQLWKAFFRLFSFAFFLCLLQRLLDCRARSADPFPIFGNRDPCSRPKAG